MPFDLTSFEKYVSLASGLSATKAKSLMLFCANALRKTFVLAVGALSALNWRSMAEVMPP